jgi:ArsR family transcriptional regulator
MSKKTHQFFHLLSDETRLRCLVLLQREGELCVCELTHALGESQPKISRHLAMLRDAGVVSDRRQGQWVYYRVSEVLGYWMRDALLAACDGVVGEEPYASDYALLKEMPNRPGSACCA